MQEKYQERRSCQADCRWLVGKVPVFGSGKEMEYINTFLHDEEGVGVVEIILILVVLISLVLIFKDQLTSIVNTIFSKITSQSNSV